MCTDDFVVGFAKTGFSILSFLKYKTKHCMLAKSIWYLTHTIYTMSFLIYRSKVPKYLDARKLCCILSKIQTKRPDLRVFCQKDTNGIANSEDPDQTAPQGAV